MPKIISLGLGAYVDAEQIVAVDDYVSGDCDRASLGHWMAVKSTILLKNGKTIFAYVKPETIRKRWQEAFALPDFLLKSMGDALAALEKSFEQDEMAEENAD